MAFCARDTFFFLSRINNERFCTDEINCVYGINVRRQLEDNFKIFLTHLPKPKSEKSIQCTNSVFHKPSRLKWLLRKKNGFNWNIGQYLRRRIINTHRIITLIHHSWKRNLFVSGKSGKCANNRKKNCELNTIKWFFCAVEWTQEATKNSQPVNCIPKKKWCNFSFRATVKWSKSLIFN